MNQDILGNLNDLISKSRYDFSLNQIKYNKAIDLNTLDYYKSICILGGGTSGYFAALAFNKHFGVPVTIIESDKVPIIGVGEATTPLIQHFLFDILKFDKSEFFEKVKPTWKMGIRFEWGKPGDYYFNYPFGQSDILSAFLNTNDINNSSLSSILMSKNSGFIVKDKENNFASLANEILYAMHLDNETFVNFLKSKSIERGVNYINADIVHIKRSDQTGKIECLVDNKGICHYYDFFVDCSGFQSILLGKTLKTNFISFDKSLFTDRALVTSIGNNGKIKPYTTAQTMDNGWCWDIPLRHENHRGYVFSSSFSSDDNAYDELLRKNPTMNNNVKIVKFKSGRYDKFISENVAGIGNSYGFVEPLESTGLHMIITEILVLIKNFSMLKNKSFVGMLNNNMNSKWDYLRWFLSIHYKFNKKIRSNFWNECNNKTDISSFEEILNIYKEIGLLSKQSNEVRGLLLDLVNDSIFNLEGIDNILLGQNILPNNINNIKLQNKKKWLTQVNYWNTLASLTIPISSDIDILSNHSILA